MATRTLSQLRDSVRQRANMENSTLCSDAEITQYINEGIDDLYARMVNSGKGMLFAKVANTLPKIGTHALQLPGDFMRLVEVNVFANARWTPVTEADPQDYFRLLSEQYQGDYSVQYFVQLNVTANRWELFLFPAKPSANVGVRYIPEAPTLSVDADPLNWPSNWEQVVIVDAAAKCLAKEATDSTFLLAEKERLTLRVLSDISSTSVVEPDTIRSLKARNGRKRRGWLPRI